jgi:hypothetical protein
MNAEENNEIDISFIFYSDTPKGKDPDAYSPTLKRFHKLLWSKPLPNGTRFDLTDTRKGAYLHHSSAIGEFFLSSDAITHSYAQTKKLSKVVSQVDPAKVISLYKTGSTIGAYIVFPGNRINGKSTLNGARGLNAKIKDRFDLTLECIRRFYSDEPSPLIETLDLYRDFFKLFESFRDYVDFFLLQDLVLEDYSAIKFHLPFNGFDQSPLPSSPAEYLEYRKNTIRFVEARNQRISSLFPPPRVEYIKNQLKPTLANYKNTVDGLQYFVDYFTKNHNALNHLPAWVWDAEKGGIDTEKFSRILSDSRKGQLDLERLIHELSSSPQIDSLGERDLLTHGALRIDGYKYAEETGFDPKNTLDAYYETCSFAPQDRLHLLCCLFHLQRFLCKCGGEQLESNSREWKAYRELFLLTSNVDVPEAYRQKRLETKIWDEIIKPNINLCVNYIQRIHVNTKYNQ